MSPHPRDRRPVSPLASPSPRPHPRSGILLFRPQGAGQASPRVRPAARCAAGVRRGAGRRRRGAGVGPAGLPPAQRVPASRRGAAAPGGGGGRGRQRAGGQPEVGAGWGVRGGQHAAPRLPHYPTPHISCLPSCRGAFRLGRQLLVTFEGTSGGGATGSSGATYPAKRQASGLGCVHACRRGWEGEEELPGTRY
jgi:hypothetical protein